MNLFKYAIFFSYVSILKYIGIECNVDGNNNDNNIKNNKSRGISI